MHAGRWREDEAAGAQRLVAAARLTATRQDEPVAAPNTEHECHYVSQRGRSPGVALPTPSPVSAPPLTIEFSTSSLTAVARVTITWPLQMRCTDARSMARMEAAPVAAAPVAPPEGGLAAAAIALRM